MQESDFSIYDAERKVRITGGILWQVKARLESGQMWHLDAERRTLIVALQPHDHLEEVKNRLFEYIREYDPRMYWYFALQKWLPSLLIFIPASLMIWLITFGAVMGDAGIAVVFLEGEEDTIFGITRFWLFMAMGAIATLILYLFPSFFSGEQDGVVQYINRMFSQRGRIREQFRTVFNILKKRVNIERVEIWNPSFGEEKQDWVVQSLLPAAVDSSMELSMQIKIDERSVAENCIARITRRATEDIEWAETYFDEHATQPLPYDFLETWEKRMLAIYAFASSANLPKAWKASSSGLSNVVSLPLVELIVEHFKERLFAEEDLKKLISLDTFASRCVNDYGILAASPYSRSTQEIWALAPQIVEQELQSAQNEMRFVYHYLQTNLESINQKITDLVSPLIINSLYAKISIYNEGRLQALRYFVHCMSKMQQYKLFKNYWTLVAAQQAEDASEGDIFRVIGIEPLEDLCYLFEKSAMYDLSMIALDFVENLHPYKGKIGKARVCERRGDYLGSAEMMLRISEQAERGEISLQQESRIDLHQNIAWAIVSGRLEKYRETGRTHIAKARALLYSEFDQWRSSEYAAGLYNIAANYEEWDGNPQGAIDNYDRALQIPGADQHSLSNLLVNKGIALRQVGRLFEGAKYGSQGAEIKAAIGDADQLPIALHNAAQTNILLAYSSKDQTERERYFLRALQQAQEGLDTQARTSSTKKRGQLLAERFIAHKETQPQAQETQIAQLQEVQSWLQSEIEAGRKDTYDVRVVVGELLAIVPAFAQQSCTNAEEARKLKL